MAYSMHINRYKCMAELTDIDIAVVIYIYRDTAE